MPPFTEKESSILAVLKKKSGRMSAQEAQREARVQAREGNNATPASEKTANAQVSKLLYGTCSLKQAITPRYWIVSPIYQTS